MKLRVLMSAYACEPGRGSEPGVGWNWARSMAPLVDLTVITRSNNRPVIEAWEAANAPLGVTWAWHDGGPLHLRLKRHLGVRWYYRQWQRLLLPKVRNLHLHHPFDATMHLTLNGFREPGWLWSLPIPFVWGPIGGLQNASRQLVALQGWRRTAVENLRSLVNTCTARYASRPRRAAEAAVLVLGANHDSGRWLDALGLPADRTMPMLEAGISAPETIDHAARDERLVLWVGSDARLKNAEFAIAAFATLRRIKPDATMVMIGLSDARWTGLQAWAHGRGIDLAGISRIPRVPQHELARHYATCGQFWFTSYRDTSGNVLLEAMATGAPCVAFDHHGVPLIMPGDAGKRIAAGEHAETVGRWVQAATAFIDDPILASKTGTAAHAVCRTRHRWEGKASCVVDRLHHLLRHGA